MKKYFMLGLAVIFVFTLGLIAYGAYLNQQGELQIMHRMEERALPVHGAEAEVRELHPRIYLPALNLQAPEMADAVALIDGRITAIHVQKNSTVRKGQPLFTIVNEKLPLQLKEVESNLLKATAQLKQASNNYARYRRLAENRATSTAQFEEAEAQYVAAQAYLEETEAKKEQLLMQEQQQTVTAPVDGKVLFLYRSAGTYVQTGTALALVGDFQRLYFDIPMEDHLMKAIDVGHPARLLFKNKDALQKAYHTSFEPGNQGEQEPFRATVEEVTPPLSEPAAYRSVRYTVENGAGLLEPQTYDDVIIEAGVGHSSLVVPIEAMIDADNDSVFVVNDESELELRQVKSGPSDGTYVEILSGLSAGETVVVSGKEGLEKGMRVRVTMENGKE